MTSQQPQTPPVLLMLPTPKRSRQPCWDFGGAPGNPLPQPSELGMI